MPNSAYPIWVWIDPTRRCNLSCSLCYTREGQGLEDLSPERFRTLFGLLLNEGRTTIRQLTMNWRGEPTLNRHLPEILGVIRDHRVEFPVEFHTNATILNEQNAPVLIDACGPGTTICVSIDGGNEASHDAQRGLGTYRRALRGANALLTVRGSRSFPKIVIHQLDLRVPREAYGHEFMKLTSMVDEWQMKTPIIPGGERRLFANAEPQDTGTPLITDWPVAVLPEALPAGPCFWAGNALCIAPNGDAYVCLLSSRGDGILGNIISDGVWPVVAATRRWREKLEVDGRSEVTHCRSCRMEEGTVSKQWSATTRTFASPDVKRETPK